MLILLWVSLSKMDKLWIKNNPYVGIKWLGGYYFLNSNVHVYIVV